MPSWKRGADLVEVAPVDRIADFGLKGLALTPEFGSMQRFNYKAAWHDSKARYPDKGETSRGELAVINHARRAML